MSLADLAHRASEFLGVDRNYVGLGPMWGAVFGAVITSLVVGGVVHSRTTRVQEASALFEFSKRFHDLMDRAFALSKDWTLPPEGPSAADRAEAGAYYRKLFDLMLNEWVFYKKGLVRRDAFLEWMTWRWGAWRDVDGASITVRGVRYQDAWPAWSQRPLMRTHPFVAFIDEVHAAPDLKVVERLVAREAPAPWVF